MTPEEFDAVDDYDDRYLYELIFGVLVVRPYPPPTEAAANDELGYWLRSYRDQHPKGKTLSATLPHQYVYTATCRRLADRLVWAGLGRNPDLRRDVPMIAAEFVSAFRRNYERDQLFKRREYKKLRIPEYWIIDRFRRTMTVVINVAGEEKEIVLGENDIYSTARLPGFELPLRRLFAVADRLKKKKTK